MLQVTFRLQKAGSTFEEFKPHFVSFDGNKHAPKNQVEKQARTIFLVGISNLFFILCPVIVSLDLVLYRFKMFKNPNFNTKMGP